MERQILYGWNAVNVSGSDGMLHRGLVVDKTDAGLLIDFGIPGKEPEFFPFERVFSHDATISHLVNGGEILFLYQLSPEQPWTWYPAKVVAHSLRVFVLVEFVWENVRIRDIFHWRRFQAYYPSSHSGPYPINLRGQNHDFSKNDTFLPDEFNEKERFFDLWKKVPHVYPVEVRGNQFFYIYDSEYHKTELAEDLCAAFVSVARAMEPTKIGLQDVRFRVCPAQMVTVGEEYSITDLPLDIMTDVFSCMDCTKRTLLGRISSDWNDIIASFSSEIIQVALSTFNHWKTALSLRKCLTSFTKYVVFAGDLNSPEFSLCTVGNLHTETLVQLAKLAGAKLCAIVLSEVPIFEDFAHKYAVADREEDPGFSEEFQAVCGRVILREVYMEFSPLNHFFKWIPGARGEVMGPDMWISKCTYAAGDMKALFDAYEANCPVVGDDALDQLAFAFEFSGNYFQDEEPHLWIQAAFLEVIKKWQRDDPRFGLHCSWEHVEAAQLHKVDNLRTLRKTTLAVLASVMDHLIWKNEGLP